MKDFGSNNSKRTILTVVISVIIIISTAAVGVIGFLRPDAFKNSFSDSGNLDCAIKSSSNSETVSENSDVMSTESFTSSSKPESVSSEDYTSTNPNQSVASTDSSVENTSSQVSSSQPNSSIPSSSQSSSSGTVKPPAQSKSFVSAIWYSYGDLDFKSNYSYNTFKAKINKMFDDAVSLGNDAVICHVRPFADAYYKSSLFPYSSYLTGTQGKDPGYDPLEYMIEAAHSRGLQFHAWLNPYRISTSTDNPNKLSADHIAKRWWNDPDKKRNVLISGNGLYFNPTVPECRKLIIDGVREIVNNYDVDGIHIDDYFYPTTDAEFDGIEYADYKADGGVLSQADWRRINVSTLIQGMYQAAHSKSGVVFGVSPSYSFDVNFNEQYADLKHWMKTAGYIDYIVPQIYFGYEHSLSKARYNNALNTWVTAPKLSSVKLYIGLGAYKIGTTDGGSDEWITDKELLAKQTFDAKVYGADGIFIFNYSTLFANTVQATAQRGNLKKALESIK